MEGDGDGDGAAFKMSSIFHLLGKKIEEGSAGAGGCIDGSERAGARSQEVPPDKDVLKMGGLVRFQSGVADGERGKSQIRAGTSSDPRPGTWYEIEGVKESGRKEGREGGRRKEGRGG